MKSGLKQKLNDWIKSENGKIVPIAVIENQVRLWGYKISNYERRLRDSESPDIGKVSHNGAIVGYFWRKGENIPSGDLPRKPMIKNDACCVWRGARGLHSSNCPLKQSKKELTLW